MQRAKKKADQKTDKDTTRNQDEGEPFTGENLCVNKDCKYAGLKHRHSTKECLNHLFCAQKPLQGIDGTFRDLPEKLPQTLVKDWDESRKRAYNGSQFIGYDHLIQNYNQYGYFGHEKPIPKGKKLVVNEEVMDSWLAAHYGLQVHEVPSGKPAGMNKHIHNYIKVTARKTRDSMKDMDKAQKKG